MEYAKDYARLITVKNKIVNVSLIRLYDGHEYNWSQQIRWNDKIYIPTDQTYDLEANYEYKINYYDEVWFDGVCIYKKPWYVKLLQIIKGIKQ